MKYKIERSSTSNDFIAYKIIDVAVSLTTAGFIGECTKTFLYAGTIAECMAYIEADRQGLFN